MLLYCQDAPAMAHLCTVQKLCERCGKYIDGSRINIEEWDERIKWGGVFRVTHNVALVMGACKPTTRLEFLRFPQIHSDHHNNKLYRFIGFKKILL